MLRATSKGCAMQVSVENIKILPNVPQFYNYVTKKNDSDCASKFIISDIKTKNDFLTWKKKLEELNKENFSLYFGKGEYKKHLLREVYVCKHAQKNRRTKYQKKDENEEESDSKRPRKEIIEGVSG